MTDHVEPTEIKTGFCGCRYTGHLGQRDLQVIERCEQHRAALDALERRLEK